MTSDYPQGWIRIPLDVLAADIPYPIGDGDHGQIKPDVYTNSGIPYIRVADIGWGKFEPNVMVYIPLHIHEANKKGELLSGDVIVAKTGATIGKCCIVPDAIPRANTSSSVGKITINRKLTSPKWILYFILSKDFKAQMWAVSEKTAQPGFNIRDLKQFEFPLAPLNEQERIVLKLEELFSRIESCRKRLDIIPALLKRFRQSVLAAACTGKLTADWRKMNQGVNASSLIIQLRLLHEKAGGYKKGNAALPTDNVHDVSRTDFPDSWEIAEMRELVDPNRPITYGILKPGPDLPSGIRYVRVADYPGDQIDLSTIRRTSKEIDAGYSRSRLRKGDILLSIRGTVGRVCEVPSILEGANITQDTARLSLQSSVNSHYVMFFLRSLSTQNRMARATKGAAVRGINIGDVRALQVPLPPISEQKEIVRRVEALFSKAEIIESRYYKAKTQVDQLTQSILAKAFRGELVPQDPSDEPAAILLERIRAERLVSEGKKSSLFKEEGN